MRYGQTRGINCFVILPQFFADKNYDATTVNSHLKRCNLGSSQSRKIQKRSVRSTLLYTEAYEQEELDLLIQGTKYLKVIETKKKKNNDVTQFSIK